MFKPDHFAVSESGGEPALRSLRESIGVSEAHTGPEDDSGRATFEQLGKQAWQALEDREIDADVTADSLQRAAREYLCTCRPEVGSTQK